METLLPIFREYGRLERMREDQGLSVEQLERWTHLKRILSSHFRPGVRRELADKQASLRVPSQLRVSFDSYGELRECLMTNISRGGVFVSTPSPLPIGTPFKLRIHVGESGETHELSGEVASVNTRPDMQGESQGMGIRFCHLTEPQQELVERLYGDAMDVAIGNFEKPS
jgi:type IV pilus assembly protein PilZ